MTYSKIKCGKDVTGKITTRCPLPQTLKPVTLQTFKIIPSFSQITSKGRDLGKDSFLVFFPVSLKSGNKNLLLCSSVLQSSRRFLISWLKKEQLSHKVINLTGPSFTFRVVMHPSTLKAFPPTGKFLIKDSHIPRHALRMRSQVASHLHKNVVCSDHKNKYLRHWWSFIF